MPLQQLHVRVGNCCAIHVQDVGYIIHLINRHASSAGALYISPARATQMGLHMRASDMHQFLPMANMHLQ